MNQHYYSEKPAVKSERFSFHDQLKGSQFKFNSDCGVFSKNEIDFGSRLLIESFSLPEGAKEILDVGCGYGPIGLSVAKSFSGVKVTMVDINERAIELSKCNAKENGIENVEIVQSNLLESVVKNHYDVVVTNPPIRTGKSNVFHLYEQAKQVLNPNGELWLVIQKKQGAPSTIEKLQTLFGEVTVLLKKKGYYIIRAKNV